jgi:hypothetical protein
MEVLLRVLLNSTKTQMSRFDSLVIHIFPQVKCSIGELLAYDTNKLMHLIYFFEDNVNAVVFALVHGKENDINVSI